MLFEFDGFRLDDDKVELTGPDGPVHCEPQVFRVLVHLVHNRDRAVTKEELLDTVWGDRFVSESTLTSRIKAARRAVGDDGQSQHVIATVHGVGYRFVAETEIGRPAGPPWSTTPRRELPTVRSELIGRDGDLTGVIATARAARCVTIVGPGGVGKTTLALAVCRALQGELADGAVFVDLVAARSPADVTRAVADAAGVQGDASRSLDRLADHLSSHRLLVVLDNCEHVLPAAAEVVDLVLGRGTEARILATSREPLAIADEHVWPLAPLDSAAPLLFVARARAADPRVEWDPADPEIVDLCGRLDGLPLALELAAGQLRRWGFAELRRQLRDEQSALARRSRRSGSRHDTITATIGWSYDLLDSREQRLLRRLGVFPSSFDVASAEALVADLRDIPMPATLGELVDKSLVVREVGSGRFRLLETIRVFAREHLEQEGEADEAFERHRQHVLDIARRTTRLDRWLSARLGAQRRADADQARQAFRASVATGRGADAVEIAIGSAFLWRNAIGCTEGAAWLDELVPLDLTPVDRVWVLILLADLGQGIGDFRQMLTAAHDALAIDDGVDPDASCIVAHYASLVHLTEPAGAREHLAHVLSLASDPRLVNLIEAFLVIPEISSGGPGEVVERLERLHRAASEDGYDGYILHWVGWMYGLAHRRADVARRWMGRQEDLLERTGIVETWITTLSKAMSESADGTDVRQMLARTLALAEREGYHADADCALALAYSEVCQGNAVAGAELLGTALRSRFNATAHFVLYRVVVEPVICAQLDPAEFTAAVERGAQRSAADALAADRIR